MTPIFFVSSSNHQVNIQYKFRFDNADNNKESAGQTDNPTTAAPITSSAIWIEITDMKEPLPMRKSKNGANQDEMIVEAKVIDCVS